MIIAKAITNQSKLRRSDTKGAIDIALLRSCTVKHTGIYKQISLVRLSVAISILVLSTQVCFSQNAPQVLKVEPPGWWPGHSINPVRLLIRGKDLVNAKVGVSGAGISATNARVNQSGTYLF